MDKTSLSIHISDSIGEVSAEYILPEKYDCILTLAHGAGAGMNHSFMVELAHTLGTKSIATLRYNLPYIEKKQKKPDFPAVAHKTVEAAILNAHEAFPSVPIFVSGKSFGGRMSSQYLSTNKHSFVKGIIFYGFPLHPAGKPSIERAEHLKNVTIPTLFLQGTKDDLAEIPLIEQVSKFLPTSTLFKIEGADHSFKAGKQNVIDLLSSATRMWVDKILLQ